MNAKRDLCTEVYNLRPDFERAKSIPSNQMPHFTTLAGFHILLDSEADREDGHPMQLSTQDRSG